MELDNGDKCYITEDTIVRFMLSRDKVISEEELKEIQDFAQFSYGKNLALYHLSFKARTEKEVREYLKKYDIDKNIVSQVIANLKEDKWINDGQYAYAIINANQVSGDKGPYVLTQKLAQKGISKSTIEEILNDFDFSEVAQRVANKLLKKYDAKIAFDELDSQVDQETTQELIFKELDKQYTKYARKYEGYELKQRLTQVLARKGYDFSDIASALREYL